LEKLEHKNLNTDVAELERQTPTTENLAVAVRQMLEYEWPFEARLARVRISETDRNVFELDA